jgi:O-methyltransferase/aklanonic acid methyltransferase
MGRRDSPVWSSLRPAGSKRRKGKAMSDEATARKREVRAVFDRVVPDYDAAGPGCFAHFGRRLVEAVGVEPGQRVLDVATGRGAVLVPAAELAGPSGAVVGIDLSEAMVRLTTDEAARRGLNARARVMDAEALDFPDATVNRVLCGFVVMFFPDLPRALAEFRRVLTPTGRLGISTWQVSQASAEARVLVELGMMEASAGPARRSFRDPEALMRPLAAAGFADVRVVTDEATFRYADAAEAGCGPALLPDCRPHPGRSPRHPGDPGTGLRRRLPRPESAPVDRGHLWLVDAPLARSRPHRARQHGSPGEAGDPRAPPDVCGR